MSFFFNYIIQEIMKLKFNILRIDDDRRKDESKDVLEAKKTSIKNILAYHYFESDEDNIKIEDGTLNINNGFPYESEDFDLFIVDFHIWEKKWLEYIEWIRQKSQYTHIIFYSQNTITDEIRLYINEKKQEWWYKNAFLEWIFICDRAVIDIKVEELIEIIDRKVNNLYSMRGLVLAETAEIDYVLSEIIDKLCIKKNISQNWFQLWKQDSTINTFNFSLWPTFSWQGKLLFVEWLSEKTSNYEKIEWLTNPNNPNNLIQDIASIQTDLNNYRNFYETTRNPLAHKKTTIQNNLLKAGNVPYTIQNLKNIRWDLLNWKKCFTKFRDCI